jgi:hypothetical protein
LDDALSSLLFNSSKVASCLTDDTGVAWIWLVDLRDRTCIGISDSI